MKRCSRCKKLLPANSDYFYRFKSNNYRLHTWCKHCKYEYDKTWRIENQYKFTKSNNKYRNQIPSKSLFNHRKQWCNEDIKYLLKWYGKISNTELAFSLGRKVQSISQKYNSMKNRVITYEIFIQYGRFIQTVPI